MEYRRIGLSELTPDLFYTFERRQVVQDCWRKVEGTWTVVAHPFIDQWGPEEYAFWSGVCKIPSVPAVLSLAPLQGMR